MSDETENAQATRKNLTFLSRKAPYGQAWAHACLDMVLSAAVFEQTITLIFMDDGVYQLLANQNGASIDSKTLSSRLQALPLYDVEQIYVDETSLVERGIDAETLILPAKRCSRTDISRMISDADQVFAL